MIPREDVSLAVCKVCYETRRSRWRRDVTDLIEPVALPTWKREQQSKESQ